MPKTALPPVVLQQTCAVPGSNFAQERGAPDSLQFIAIVLVHRTLKRSWLDVESGGFFHQDKTNKISSFINPVGTVVQVAVNFTHFNDVLHIVPV